MSTQPLDAPVSTQPLGRPLEVPMATIPLRSVPLGAAGPAPPDVGPLSGASAPEPLVDGELRACHLAELAPAPLGTVMLADVALVPRVVPGGCHDSVSASAHAGAHVGGSAAAARPIPVAVEVLSLPSEAVSVPTMEELEAEARAAIPAIASAWHHGTLYSRSQSLVQLA